MTLAEPEYMASNSSALRSLGSSVTKTLSCPMDHRVNLSLTFAHSTEKSVVNKQPLYWNVFVSIDFSFIVSSWQFWHLAAKLLTSTLEWKFVPSA